MRARRTVRVPTAAKLAVGVSVLAFPATAVAVTSDSSHAQAIPAASLHSARPLSVGYGHDTIVRGSAPTSDAGTRIALEYRPTNARHWRTVDTGRVRADGDFGLAARLGRSGRLQVVPLPSDARSSLGLGSNQAGADSTTAPTSTTASPAGVRLSASAVRRVTVRPELKLSRQSASAVVGQTAPVRGHLLPGVAGRKLVLEVRRDGRWIAVARGRTRRGGAFDLHYAPATVGSQTVHVAFAGDRLNSHADSNPEAIVGMQYAEVSWYEDAGNTACGFHATYGIASRTLPCGSKVTLSYGGRSVVATVDDRGPFVYSRLYDLNQNTAGALGMAGVATVLASV